MFYYQWGSGNVTPNKADDVSVHFVTSVTPFITDAYNFTLVSDAGNIWTFDGYVVNNNMNPVGNGTYSYNNVALNAFQTYNVLIDFADWGGNAEIQMYWKTSTISNQTIPKENLSIPYDTASSPYQITVNCPTGYKVGGAAMNQWVTNWGDGLIYGAEVWDDANSVSGDGWASDWTTIEDGWIWVNGSTTHKSDWSIWDAGYDPNLQKITWIVAETSNGISILLFIFAIVFTIRTLLSLISVIREFSSIQGTFSSLNQVQLIMILPLVGAFIPTNVVQFIAGLKITLNFLTYVNIVEIVPSSFRKYDYKQAISYLSLINFTSQSSLLNFMNFAYPIFLILLVHLISAFLKYINKNADQSNWIIKIIFKTYEGMTFGNYIRLILFYHLYLLIASLSELYLFRFNKTGSKISMIFAAFLFLFWMLITVFAFWQIFSIKLHTSEDDVKERRPCIRWFSGLKESKVSRFYGVLFFVRRQVFWVLILLFQDISMIVKVSVYASLQFVYIALLCYLQPFNYLKDMAIDWINELIYFVLCILLWFFNTENAWSMGIQYTYIWIIISNNIIMLLFEIISIFKRKSMISFKIDLLFLYELHLQEPFLRSNSIILWIILFSDYP